MDYLYNGNDEQYALELLSDSVTPDVNEVNKRLSEMEQRLELTSIRDKSEISLVKLFASRLTQPGSKGVKTGDFRIKVQQEASKAGVYISQPVITRIMEKLGHKIVKRNGNPTYIDIEWVSRDLGTSGTLNSPAPIEASK